MVESSRKDAPKMEDYLKSLEKKHGFQIILTLETGSRAHGLSTEHSDHDIKGLYVLPKSAYATAKQDSFEKIKVVGTKFPGFKVPIDIEFLELKTFLNELKSGEDVYLRWLFSDVIYRDKYPEIRKTVLENCALPNTELLSRLTKDLQKIETNAGTKAAGKMINMIVDSLILLWIQLRATYPVYNVYDLADKLKELKEGDGMTETLLSGVEYCMEQVQQLYYVKKKGKTVNVPADYEVFAFVKSVCELKSKFENVNKLTSKHVEELIEKAIV